MSVGEIAAATALGVCALGGWVRMQRKLARIADGIRRMRVAAGNPLDYRQLTDADRRSRDLVGLDAFDLGGAGIEPLGELTAVGADDRAHVTRWFVDGTRTTFGCVEIMRVRSLAIPIALFASVRGDGAVYTRRIPRAPTVVSPPFVRRQDVPATTPLADALAQHRAFAGDGEWLRIESLDDVLRETARMRAMTIAWREAQPPAELLEQDLRAILGKHYDTLAKQIMRRLAPTIPTARAV